MTEHFFYLTKETRRGIYAFCGIVVILLIYKHLAADRIQTQRIETLESEMEELRVYLEHSGSTTAGNMSSASSPTPHATSPDHPQSDRPAGAYTAHRDNNETNKHEFTSDKFQKPICVELNGADSILLCRIPGIGAKTASAIIRYRNRLGGYTHVSQVAEAAHWVTPEQLQQWQNVWLRADSSLVTHLAVNSADFKTLLRHPYLDYAQVKAIFSVRQNRGRISSWSDITATGIFSAEDVARLHPYLLFD
jgi:DNA uptake protein ComE-like DNA-binding protein